MTVDVLISPTSHCDESGDGRIDVRSQFDRAGGIDAASPLREKVVTSALVVREPAARVHCRIAFTAFGVSGGADGNASRCACTINAAVPLTTAAAMLVPLSRR